MKSNATTHLAALASAVRDSSLKRLRRVPKGMENWRPVETAMSFADIAFHLREADIWLFTKLKERNLSSIKGVAHAFEAESTKQFLNLINELEIIGKQRTTLIESILLDQLEALVPDDRYGGEITVWWLIARGTLDHEAHHRGQIANYLRLLKKN